MEGGNFPASICLEIEPRMASLASVTVESRAVLLRVNGGREGRGEGENADADVRRMRGRVKRMVARVCTWSWSCTWRRVNE